MISRSTSNTLIKNTIKYLNTRKFFLPAWAYWHFTEWQSHKKQCQNIFTTQLGWDIFDNDDFQKYGMILFTIRNGSITTNIKPYCEKIIVMQEEQQCPYHYHKDKTEDIINRGETDLGFKLAHAHKDGTLSDTDIEIEIDSIPYTVKAQEEIILHKGQSITLYPYCYHTFYPISGKILIGEVSKINDDHNDNFFLESVSRFPLVNEDEEIVYPLVNDYEKLIP